MIPEEGQPTNPEPKADDVAEPGAESSGGGKTYTQDQVDDITAKRSASRDKRIAQLEADLEKTKHATMTDHEKAIEAARKEAAADADAKYAALERRASVKDALLASGIKPDRIAAAAKLAPEDGDPAEVAAQIAGDYPEWVNGGTTKRMTGTEGGPVRPSPDVVDFADPVALQRAIEERGPGWYAANRDKIKSAQDAATPPAYRRI